MKIATLLISIPLLGTVASAQLVTPYSRTFLAPGPSGGYWNSSIEQNLSNSSFMEQPFTTTNAFRPTRVRVRGAFIHEVATSNPASPLSSGFEVWFTTATSGRGDYQRYSVWSFTPAEVSRTFVGVLPFAGFEWSVYDLDIDLSQKLPSLNTTDNPNGTLRSGELALGVREFVPTGSRVRFAVQTQFDGLSNQYTSSGTFARTGTSMVIQGVPEPLTIATISFGLIGLARRRRKV